MSIYSCVSSLWLYNTDVSPSHLNNKTQQQLYLGFKLSDDSSSLNRAENRYSSGREPGESGQLLMERGFTELSLFDPDQLMEMG